MKNDFPFSLNFRDLILSVMMIFFLVPLTLPAQVYVTTYAGTGTQGFVNGDTSIASFNHPFGICLDNLGNLFIADAYNHCIRRISTDGVVTTFAGAGIAGYLDGTAGEARFNQPINICFDNEGNLLVSDFLNQRIRKISTDSMVTTIAGTGVAGYHNGPVMEAKFNYPRGICVDDTGNIYIGDSWNHRIRRIGTDGMVTTWAGGGTSIGVQSIGDYVDGSDTSARFYTPCEVSIDQFENIFVADAYNHRIRMIDPLRNVTTVAGSGDIGPAGGGFANGPGETAQFNTPTACFAALDGCIYVGDGSNQRIRKIDPDHFVTTLAGSGETGFEDGPDSLATFNFPRGSVMDFSLNRLFVVDYYNHAIRIVHLIPFLGTEEYQEAKIIAWPNPFRDVLHLIPGATLSNVDIRIYNTAGKIVFSKNVSGIEFNIETGKLEAGIYFLEIAVENKSRFVQKLIKVGN